MNLGSCLAHSAAALPYALLKPTVVAYVAKAKILTFLGVTVTLETLLVGPKVCIYFRQLVHLEFGYVKVIQDESG